MNLWEYVPNFIKASTPMDLVDILVVAFLVYQGIKLVRETRANQLIKGLGALLLLYFVASQLKLKTLSFLMGNVLQIGAVALLVVFQPELPAGAGTGGPHQIHGLRPLRRPSDQEDEQSRWKTAHHGHLRRVCLPFPPEGGCSDRPGAGDPLGGDHQNRHHRGCRPIGGTLWEPVFHQFPPPRWEQW